MAHTCLCENNGDDQKYYVSNNKSLGQLGHVQPDVKYSTSCRENNDGSHYRAADFKLGISPAFWTNDGQFPCKCTDDGNGQSGHDQGQISKDADG